MTVEGQLLFLGTGGSMGIPVIGCPCPVCTSTHPKNQRLRPSVLLTLQGKAILIDAGPDYRTQALRHCLDHLDGVIFTHAHHDHIAGLDDLRVYYMRSQQPLPCLASRTTAQDLKTRYDYIFTAPKSPHQLTTKIVMQTLEKDRGEVEFVGIKMRYLSYEQGGMQVNGFCIGNLAFISDIRHYPDTIFDDLRGIEILVVSALRFEPSPLHLTVDEAVHFSKKIGAKETWLTHIAHELDHDATNAYLPPNVRMAYDGLKIVFAYGTL